MGNDYTQRVAPLGYSWKNREAGLLIHHECGDSVAIEAAGTHQGHCGEQEHLTEDNNG